MFLRYKLRSMEAKIPEIVRSSRDSEMLRPPRNDSLSNEDDKKTSEMMSFLRNIMDRNATTPSRNSSEIGRAHV